MWDEIIAKGTDWVRNGPGTNRRFSIDVHAEMAIMRFEAERDKTRRFGAQRAISFLEKNISRDAKSLLNYNFDVCVAEINHAVSSEPLPAAQG